MHISFLSVFSLIYAIISAHTLIADETGKNQALIDSITSRIKYLASDQLEGRGVTTEGINKAADYIASHFEQLGLKVDSYSGTAFQPFEISTEVELGPDENNFLRITGPDSGEGAYNADLVLDYEFNPLAIGATGKFDAEVVFAGYGIEAPDLGYDDWANLEVKNKVVIILRKEPQQNNPESKFDGVKSSRHATFQAKVSNAYQRGAAAVILVNDAAEPGKYLSGLKHALSQYSAQLKALTSTFDELDAPTAEEIAKHKKALRETANNISDTVSELGGDGDAILGFTEAGAGTSRKSMPVFFARRASIEPMIVSALGRSLADIESKIDESLKPIVGPLEGWKINGSADLIQNRAAVKNVIGVLEGSGKLKHETVVIGAHYDHLGYGGQGSLAPWTMEIHNGADDNSSGTTGMMEIATLLAKSKEKDRRRVVFIAFSAEERGLIGSSYYVNNPLFKLEDTVAMINLDMIGRLSENKLIVTGTGTSPSWEPFLDELDSNHDFVFTRQPEGTGPSDHQSFYLKGIPVINLFTGLHEFYHRPSDDPEIINYAGIAKIVEYGADIAKHIQTMPVRPRFSKAEKKRNVANTGGVRPYFGSIPDYADNADGLALTGVSLNGPAEKAGIKPKDIIVGIEKYKIGGIEDFDSALRKFKAGDKVKVVVLRGKKKLTLEVVLGAPR